MSTLATLKLVATKKPQNLPPIVARRRKLSARLWEQIQLARSQATGQPFVVNKLRTIRDSETGVRTSVEVTKRLIASKK